MNSGSDWPNDPFTSTVTIARPSEHSCLTENRRISHLLTEMNELVQLKVSSEDVLPESQSVC